jgi:hypothetical protein
MQNPNYKEIEKLNKMLNVTGIQHTITRLFDGWQVIYYYNGKRIADAIQHCYSYGANDDLLEISGLLTEEEARHDSVLGYVSAAETFQRIISDFLARRLREMTAK